MTMPIPFPPHARRISADTDAELPAFPRLGTKSKRLPKLFQITYDASRFHLKQTHTLWGTQYPNGTIALENGVVFGDGLTELEEHFKRAGSFEVRWSKIVEVEE